MGLKLLDSPSDGAADIDGATNTDGRGDGNEEDEGLDDGVHSS